ncbi:MAG: hypothetical protein AAB074_12960 [Planctomycetota bacterium]
MEIPFAMFADHVSTTNDGKLNILGVFETVKVSAGSALAQCFLLYRVEANREELLNPQAVAASVHKPDGTEVMRFETSLMFGNVSGSPAGTVFRANVALCLQGVRFDIAGEWKARFMGGGGELAQITLLVELR